MNPYLTEANHPSQLLEATLAYYGISIDKFKAMSDGQVRQMVDKFSDVLNDGKVSKSIGGVMKRSNRRNNYGEYTGNTMGFLPKDSGSFSRYFSLDSWWQKKLKELPESVQRTFPMIICPKASKAEKNRGLEGFEQKETRYGSGGQAMPSGNANPKKTLNRNIHPTTKPIKLMSYLITLGSRPGDIVLDPFIGSGTTCVAAKMLGRQYIGIEKESEYVEIAKARLKAIEEQLELEI